MIGQEPIDAGDDAAKQCIDTDALWTLAPSQDLRGAAAGIVAAEQWADVLAPQAMAVLATLMRVIWAEGRTEVVLTPADLRRSLHPDLVPCFDAYIDAFVARGLVRRRSAANGIAYALSWQRLVAGPDAHRRGMRP